MKAMPILISAVYAMLGLFFIRFAIIFSQGNIWNSSSLFLIIMATMNFSFSVRTAFANLRKDKVNI